MILSIEMIYIYKNYVINHQDDQGACFNLTRPKLPWYNIRRKKFREDNMDKDKIQRFIARQKVAFICSVDEEGYPNVKAMLRPRKSEGLGSFYFSTNTSSMRVKQYQNEPKACIYFYHKGLIKYEGVMLKGRMEVLTDQKTKEMIWRKGDTL